MESTSRTLEKPRNPSSATDRWHGGSIGKKHGRDGDAVEDEDGKDDDEECDPEAWSTLSQSFKEVQSVLDQNRVLIHQVNENQQSKVPDNMVKNVALIREINGNISRVMGLYSDISDNFINIIQRRRSVLKNGDDSSSNSKAVSSGDWNN